MEQLPEDSLKIETCFSMQSLNQNYSLSHFCTLLMLAGDVLAFSFSLGYFIIVRRSQFDL